MAKEQIAYEKYIKDGEVAVLVSSGFGAGWYTWNTAHEGLLFDKDIVEAVLADDLEKAGDIAQAKYGEHVYTGGKRDLRVVWVPVGSQFEIDEYDGSESLHVIGDREYHVA